MDTHAAQALIRFGLGRRGGDPLPTDPAAWLRGQLTTPDPGPPGPNLIEAMTAFRQDRADPKPAGERPRVATNFLADDNALADYAVDSMTPFRERLVRFWANHFTISTRGGMTGVYGADYIRSAIRPHVTGKFNDMLLAVMRHPAMLLYLDNAGSTGPNSQYGLRSGKGLNENLARECMELHTVSPASGYTQADVTNFAKLITGWSVGRQDEVPGYRFRPALHEPGAQTVMGQSFPWGEEGGEAALAFLGSHPATHRHLATKLVAHFVADDPPQAAIRTLEGVLRDTNGDLAQAALALVALPQAWQTPLAKLRAPQDYIIAAIRALGLPPDNRPAAGSIMRALGQPQFGAPFPIGWSDKAADWAGPESLMRRVDWAYGFSNRGAALDPQAVADASLGPLLTPGTANQIRGAGSRRDGLTLLLTSPEFQRR